MKSQKILPPLIMIYATLSNLKSNEHKSAISFIYWLDQFLHDNESGFRDKQFPHNRACAAMLFVKVKGGAYSIPLVLLGFVIINRWDTKNNNKSKFFWTQV